MRLQTKLQKESLPTGKAYPYLSETILDASNQIEKNNFQNNNQPRNNYEGIEFRIQIAASSKKLELKSYNFNGLNNVQRKKEESLFKYYYGSTSDYNKIRLLKINAIEKGYKTCLYCCL